MASLREFVVGGFTAPTGSRKHFGALLLGVYDAQGRLRYAGRVGSGFSQRSRAELRRKLAPLEREKSPFANPPSGAAARGVRWVRPRLVARVEWGERTRAARARRASFRGLREYPPSSPARVDPLPEMTHPDRVLYPDEAITKRDLARYYAEVADFMLPHVELRPLTLVRCPEGIREPCFYQKHPTRGTSPAVHAVAIRESRGVRDYMTVVDGAGLLSLVQLGALEIHAWGARAPDVEHPDLVTFDLDPDAGVPWSRTVAAAHAVRARLAELGLVSFAKTTGGKGVHVVVPLAPRAGWTEVKAFAHALVSGMVRDDPDLYLAKASKAARRGKIFLDYLRNTRGATAICPYSTRARAGAPVATPVSWSELTAELDPLRFDLRSVPKRLARRSRDPWEGYTKVRQVLPAAPR